MTLELIPRDEWLHREPQATKSNPTGRQKPLDLDRPIAIIDHWIDGVDMNEAYPVVQRGQNIVDFHMDGRGWSWGAYSFMLHCTGTVLELHGLDTRGFAEGPVRTIDDHRLWGPPGWQRDVFGDPGTSWNDEGVSILWIAGTNFEPPVEMIRARIELGRYIRSRCRNVRMNVPHCGLQIKPCPGPAILALIEAGTFGPNPAFPDAAWPGAKRPPKPEQVPDPAAFQPASKPDGSARVVNFVQRVQTAQTILREALDDLAR